MIFYETLHVVIFLDSFTTLNPFHNTLYTVYVRHNDSVPYYYSTKRASEAGMPEGFTLA